MATGTSLHQSVHMVESERMIGHRQEGCYEAAFKTTDTPSSLVCLLYQALALGLNTELLVAENELLQSLLNVDEHNPMPSRITILPSRVGACRIVPVSHNG